MEWMSRIYGAEGVLEASDIDVDVGGDVGIDGGGGRVSRLVLTRYRVLTTTRRTSLSV